MIKKFVGMAICMLLLLLAIPVVCSSGDTDVEIFVYAGTRQNNIGTGIGFWVYNHKQEPVTATISVDMEFRFHPKQETFGFNVTIGPEHEERGNFGMPRGIKHIRATVQIDDMEFTRDGFSIANLVLFFR